MGFARRPGNAVRPTTMDPQLHFQSLKPCDADALDGGPRSEEESVMMNKLIVRDQNGRVAVPMLLWFAGVPFGIVVLLWLLFFRGH